jgi:hypothetical protein
MEGFASGLTIGQPNETPGVNRFDNETDLIGMPLNEQAWSRTFESGQDITDCRGFDLPAELSPAIPTPGQDRFFLSCWAWKFHEFDKGFTGSRDTRCFRHVVVTSTTSTLAIRSETDHWRQGINSLWVL